MSSVVISGDVSGSVTLQAPSAAGTTVLTLPATSGTVITGAGGVTGTSAGGTGLSSFTSGGAMYATSTSALTTGILPVASGGTGTATPSLVGGTNITISGSWPNQTVTAAGGDPTTAQVLSATAGASAGAVGTYMIARQDVSAISFGGTIAGSSLTPSNCDGIYLGSTQSGTWRCMGMSNGVDSIIRRVTAWLRIS